MKMGHSKPFQALFRLDSIHTSILQESIQSLAHGGTRGRSNSREAAGGRSGRRLGGVSLVAVAAAAAWRIRLPGSGSLLR